MFYYFLVVSFARDKKQTVCLISFSKFSDALTALTCASAIRNLRSICFGFNILIPSPVNALYLASDVIAL